MRHSTASKKLTECTLGDLEKVIARVTPDNVIKGLPGIAALFGVGIATAKIYRNTWLKPAVQKIGKVLIVDRNEALRLFKENSCN